MHNIPNDVSYVRRILWNNTFRFYQFIWFIRLVLKTRIWLNYLFKPHVF